MPALELARLDLSTAHLRMLRELLQQHVPEAEVWAYGSRVTGGAQECSDLDLVLRQPQDLRRPTPGLPELRSALQDSMLPILVEVHDWAGLPASFRVEIERAWIVLQQPGEPADVPPGTT
ncbi:MAG: hypothetical protein RJA44_2372 [Pseudomonadota bacterium]|jgi:predicted nucleotidyltransferase